MRNSRAIYYLVYGGPRAAYVLVKTREYAYKRNNAHLSLSLSLFAKRRRVSRGHPSRARVPRLTGRFSLFSTNGALTIPRDRYSYTTLHPRMEIRRRSSIAMRESAPGEP